jgi:Family of unknown function (DUF6714)
MEREEVEAAIRAAFAGVRLGSGISLRQAQAADTWRDDGHTEAEWRALPRSEVTDDWAAVPGAELERDCTAYLDAEGLRYYLPALMLWLLDHYDDEHRLFNEGASMALIGTTTALDQRERHPPGFLELLTPQQRRAIALYVRALPELVELDHEDAARMARAWRDVWSHELAGNT